MKKRYWILIGMGIFFSLIIILGLLIEETDELENMPLYKKLNECRADCVGEKPEKATLTDIQILMECDRFCDELYEVFGEEGLDKHLEEIRKSKA